MPLKRQAPVAAPAPFARVFATIFGAVLGLTLLKFGNPPIMERYVTAPGDIYELLLGFPWPIGWAYRLLILMALLGLGLLRKPRSAPQWLMALPLFWLAWQYMAGTQSIDSRLSLPTLKHFLACAACFYLGLICLGRLRNLGGFWVGIIVAMVLVLAVGFEQHFGGLEETKRYFFLYLYPKLTEPPPPEYLKKISSGRIFSTLFYPNALAGALVLLLPPILALIWVTRRMTTGAKGLLSLLLGGAALACLYWSGSKGGWLLMLTIGLIALCRLPFRNEYKVVAVSCILVAGLSGFFWKYAGFFQRGATSVSARFDYWRAAIQTAKARPIFGTGPGTFAHPYQRIKRPESEMARLVHNDYLEQASDSGLPGFLSYSLFIAGGLACSYPSRRRLSRMPDLRPGEDWIRFATWLGLLGWSLQGLLEFGLYIPATAWPAFALLGWLLGTGPERLVRSGKELASTKPEALAKSASA